jgi:hypothetical protein
MIDFVVYKFLYETNLFVLFESLSKTLFRVINFLLALKGACIHDNYNYNKTLKKDWKILIV